ncbi:hypothetical protein MBLNU459_g0910t1 [Dothideomycetes sp. NU459]
MDRENEFVLLGYRPTSHSIAVSLESLLYLNNETVSMYSHLLGAVFFTALVPYFYTKVDPKSTTEYEVVLVFSIYFLGVATCFVLSTMCHLLWNHSPHYAALGNQFDYLGIVVLMWGASIPTIYFGFWCDPRLQRFYWIMVRATEQRDRG